MKPDGCTGWQEPCHLFVPGPMKKISKFYYTVRISFTDEMQYGIWDGSAENPGY